MDSFSSKTYDVSWWDEGAYMHSARTKALFGEWQQENDSWNPLYMSPIGSYLTYWSYLLLGVGTFSTRIVPALLSFIAVIVSSILIYRKDRLQGLIFMILSMTNVMLVAYSRLSMLEYLVIMFELLIIGLMMNNKNISWFIIGLIIPCFVFVKMTSVFIMLALPLSLLLYYLLRKNRAYLKKLIILIVGSIISSILWLIFWVIPQFNQIIGSNSYLGTRAALSLGKFNALVYHTSKFILINPLLALFFVIGIISISKRVISKSNFTFMELFIITTSSLFLIQSIIVDYALRRLVLLIPVIILLATFVITSIGNFDFSYRTKKINFDKKKIIFIIISICLIINLCHFMPYFSRLKTEWDHHSSIKDASIEIGNIIPEGAFVYSADAVSLSKDNKIRPYYSYPGIGYANLDEKMLSMMKSGKINYGILRYDIFNPGNLEKNDIHFAPNSEILLYMQDDFKLIHIIYARYTKYDPTDQEYYIYQKK
jgi:antibiotic biosynthesis monooxygenase (ABM) superfamily enzyme